MRDRDSDSRRRGAAVDRGQVDLAVKISRSGD